MEGLSFDNILGEHDIETLFTAPNAEEPHKEQDSSEVQEAPEESGKQKEKNNATEVVNPETLFDEKPSEIVGSGKNTEGEQEDTVPGENPDGTSPNNFYSSIANALAVDGIFPNLNKEAVKKAVDAESFSNLIEEEVKARFDDRQRRIMNALDNGVEPSSIKKYENTLNFINSISDAAVAEESEKGEQLRYNLIYQDFLNKGMTPEKAKKLTERTVDAGTDIEDAKEALASNREYFAEVYNRTLQEAQMRADAAKAERAKRAKELQDSLMKDKQLLGDMEISQDLRKKAFDAVSVPVYKDPETGEYLNALQKYESEHRGDFLKYTSIIFALTDGFTDFDSFVKGKVKKEMRKGLRELEQTLNNTRRAGDGSLRMVTNQKEDPNSFIGKGWKLDI